MSRHHEPGRDWHSIEENPAPPRTRRQLSPAAGASSREDVDLSKAKQARLFILIGTIGGLFFLLISVFVARSAPPPPPPAPEPVAKAPPKPKPLPPPKAGPKTPAERIKDLAEREKASPRAFRTLYLAWDELRKDAPPEAQETAREQMERL